MHDRDHKLSAQTDLFEGWLKQMVQHRAEERTQDCAIIFLENPPEGIAAPQLGEPCAVPLATLQAVEGGGGHPSDQDLFQIQVPSILEPGSKGSRSDRYVQFAFMKKIFYIDLPKNTIWPGEARRLMSRRSGFRHLSDHRFSWMSPETWKRLVEDFNPVQKEYLNADTRSAAEDMAYIFFTLWQFPPDWEFYQRSLVFNGRTKRPWEGEGWIDRLGCR